MLDMTAASEAVRIATQASYAQGLIVGAVVAVLVIMVVAAIMNRTEKIVNLRNDYMKTLTDSEYRKYNEMLNKAKQ